MKGRQAGDGEAAKGGAFTGGAVAVEAVRDTRRRR